MPRLIHVNGPPGIGKSTLARWYADDHPGVLDLDIDQVRCLIGGWRRDFNGAGALARPIALAMAQAHLDAGHDVVLPQFLGRLEEIAKFERVADVCGAAFVEVVLMDDKDEAVRRFGARGQDDETPWHRHVQQIVDENGGVILLERMYDQLLEVIAVRPRAEIVRTRHGLVDEAYAALVAAVEPS